jgi:hypothetical protein
MFDTKSVDTTNTFYHIIFHARQAVIIYQLHLQKKSLLYTPVTFHFLT